MNFIDLYHLSHAGNIPSILLSINSLNPHGKTMKELISTILPSTQKSQVFPRPLNQDAKNKVYYQKYLYIHTIK